MTNTDPSHNPASDDSFADEASLQNTETETPAPETQDSVTDFPPAQDSAEARIAALEAEVARTKDQLLRTLADADNIRKRALREREDAGKFAIASFARDLLDFSDNFRRAIESIPADARDADPRVANVLTGIESMENDLVRTFEKHGIAKIIPLDAPFDPNLHEVLFEAPGTGKPAGTIIQVIEPGYMIKDRLLRPARVGVAKDDGTTPVGNAGTHIDQQA